MKKFKLHIEPILGALFFDLLPFVLNNMRHGGWVNIKNRKDRASKSPNGRGITIESPWSSDLYVCKMFPVLGKYMLKKAIKDWPIKFSANQAEYSHVDLSFIIPHRGVDRLPLLKTVIKSILSQKDVNIECIVVEQSLKTETEGLPENIRKIHLPGDRGCDLWRKSWAFNEGVKVARGKIVVCHDGDIIVPEKYGLEIMKLITEQNYDVVFPQRFLFYLSQKSTKELIENKKAITDITPDRINQNWRGGTFAIRQEAYFTIGGFDERFSGWGGEDLEFYDRCLVLNGYRYGFIPFIHLWHPEQATKYGNGRRNNLQFFENIMSIPREKRIYQVKFQRIEN